MDLTRMVLVAGLFLETVLFFVDFLFMTFPFAGFLETVFLFLAGILFNIVII